MNLCESIIATDLIPTGPDWETSMNAHQHADQATKQPDKTRDADTVLPFQSGTGNPSRKTIISTV